jgi:hypothetical protein
MFNTNIAGRLQVRAVTVVILVGLGAPVRGQDLMTPIPVNVPCGNFEDYARQHQDAIIRAIGGRADNDTYWGATLWHFLPPVTAWNRPSVVDWVYDVRHKFRCQCSGLVVENYERDCPVGLRCFTDHSCPPGQDCSVEACGSAHMTHFNVLGSVYSAFFQWSPQPAPKQCQATMDAWNEHVLRHEQSHNTDDRAAIDAFFAEMAKLETPEVCAANDNALNAGLDKAMEDRINKAFRDLLDNRKGFAAELHSHSETSPEGAPDCSCLEQ